MSPMIIPFKGYDLLANAERYSSHINHFIITITEQPGKILLNPPVNALCPGFPLNHSEEGEASAQSHPNEIFLSSDLPVLASQTKKMSENTHTHPHPQSVRKGCLDYPINAVEGAEARGEYTKLRSSRTPTL
jgi:hypothetical protein